MFFWPTFLKKGHLVPFSFNFMNFPKIRFCHSLEFRFLFHKNIFHFHLLNCKFSASTTTASLKEFKFNHSKRSLGLSTSVLPFTNNTQSQAFSRLLLQLNGEGIIHILLFVWGLISVECQAHSLWCLSQDIYCFIVCGLSQVNSIHLYTSGTWTVRNQVSWGQWRSVGGRGDEKGGREEGKKQTHQDHPPQISLFFVNC